MLIYIFKSVACMAIFLVFYKLLLEKESMHVFKRFYLLLALATSLIIPAVVFTEYVVVEPTPYTEIQQSMVTNYDYIGVPQTLENDVLDIEPILWTIYFLGFSFFGLKFIKNLFQIIARIRKNPKQKSSRFIQVLLRENFPPHTFFKYIFLNKKKLEANEIPEEVLLHEETHARQKHSWDVVFIELLQLVLWFNPLVYLFKKAIKLNHEFLADQAVIKQDVDKVTYQNTLLSFVSPDNEKRYQSQLANAINYSSIKKRFKVMKTQTSKKAVLLRSLLLLPLLAILIFGFSETKLIEKEITTSKMDYEQDLSQTKSTNDIVIHINQEGQLLIEDELVTLKELKNYLSRINSDLSFEQKQKVVRSAIYVDTKSPKTVIEKVNRILTEYGSATIDVIGPKVANLYNSERKASLKQVAKYNELAEKYNAIPIEKRKIPLADLSVLETIFKMMSVEQKTKSQDFPECLLDIKQPKFILIINKGIIELNGKVVSLNLFAKEVDALTKDWEETDYTSNQSQVQIIDTPKGFLKKVSEEFKKTHYSKANEGMSIIPPPPPKAPKPPKSQKLLEYVKELASNDAQFYYDNKPITSEKGINIIIHKKYTAVETLPYVNKTPEVRIYQTIKPTSYSVEKITKELEEAEAKLKKAENEIKQAEKEMQRVKYIKGEVDTSELETPLPPLPPKSPLDHVIEMAKKGAIFKYKGKGISSDKAIDIIKNNEDLSISTKTKNNNPPIVKISKYL